MRHSDWRLIETFPRETEMIDRLQNAFGLIIWALESSICDPFGTLPYNHALAAGAHSCCSWVNVILQGSFLVSRHHFDMKTTQQLTAYTAGSTRYGRGGGGRGGTNTPLWGCVVLRKGDLNVNNPTMESSENWFSASESEWKDSRVEAFEGSV